MPLPLFQGMLSGLQACTRATTTSLPKMLLTTWCTVQQGAVRVCRCLASQLPIQSSAQECCALLRITISSCFADQNVSVMVSCRNLSEGHGEKMLLPVIAPLRRSKHGPLHQDKSTCKSKRLCWFEPAGLEEKPGICPFASCVQANSCADKRHHCDKRPPVWCQVPGSSLP